MLQHRLREMKILILNSGSLDLLLLQDILASEGYLHHKGCTDAALMPSLLHDFAPDLVVLGAAPCCEAVEILSEVRGSLPVNYYLPSLVVTPADDPIFKRCTIAAGATDFLHLPLDRTEVLLRVRNLLYARHLYVQLSQLNGGREDGSLDKYDGDNTQEGMSEPVVRRVTFSALGSCRIKSFVQFQTKFLGRRLFSRAW